MKFEKILPQLVSFFKDTKCNFAMVGAFSLHAYGLSRSTADLDFITELRCQEGLVHFLEGLGYETIYRSSGYSNHVHPISSMGRLDFIYIYGKTAETLFSETKKTLELCGCKVPVPRPEHIIALKVLAMKNNPSRTFQEMADIQFLMDLPGIDDSMVKESFKKWGMLERYNEIKEKQKFSK